MTTSHVLAVLLATIAQFAVGGIWYMPLFGNLWGQIHCFDKMDKATQKEMKTKMMPMMGLQLVMTLLTTIVLSKLIIDLPEFSPYALAVMSWFGFIVPTQVSAVVFGGTEPRWILTKIGIMIGGSLICLLVAAAVLSFVK